MFCLIMLMMLCNFGKAVTVSAATSWPRGVFGMELTGYLDNSGVLTISGTGPMKPWTSGTSPVYPVRAAVKSVVIENGVTNIGSYCFQGCTALTSVSISDSVTSIYGYAFTNCTSITAISIPLQVSIINSNTFYGCSKLSAVNMPYGLTQIGQSAFAYCQMLTAVDIPESVTSIVGSAFRCCTSLSAIDIPDSVTTVASCAFQGCTGLLSAVVGSGCTLLGDYVFDGCVNLAAVEIGRNVNTIGYSAFKNCSRLANIVNRYNGSQTIDPTAFNGAGSSQPSKTASCLPANMNFASVITAAGYSLAYIDTVPPEASHILSPAAFTSLAVTIAVHAADNVAVEKITLPDDTPVFGDTAIYTVTENGTYPFIIQDTAGNQLVYPVIVPNICRNISISLSDNVSCLIDPNESNPFVASFIELVNHSQIPVSVSVLSLSTSQGSDLNLADVAPSAFPDWNALTNMQTRANIAICISVQETASEPGGWMTISPLAPLYAVQIQDKTQLGILEANGGTGHLCLSALCGRAWDKGESVDFCLVLDFDAAG